MLKGHARETCARRVQNSKNRNLKKRSRSLTSGGRLREVPTVEIRLGHFWSFWWLVACVGWSRFFKIDRSILQVLRIDNMMITKMLLSFIKLTVGVFYDDIGCYCKITIGIYHVSQQNVPRTNKKSLPLSSSWKGDSKILTCRLIC